MNKKVTLGLLLLTAVALVGMPGALAAVDYSATIQPIWNANCNFCHPTAGVDLSSYSKVMASTFNGNPIVIPGNAANSILYQAVSGPVPQMPPGGSLTSAEIKSIGDWINEGALAAPPAIPVLTTITVSPATATLDITGTQVFTATARDQTGAVMAGISISFTSSNTLVGDVSPSTATTDILGTATTTFTAKGAGSATVIAANGAVNGTATVTVNPPPAPTYTVTFTVNDSLSLIQGASVVMDGINIKTDNNGKAVFFNVANGNHKYTVSKRGYKRASGIVTVNNADVSKSVTLTRR
jgi:Bacterial Ig-like domain (group 1)/Planctomycete cytochrome C